MTVPIRRNLVLYQGATFRLSLLVRNKTTGAPVDLTGHTARMQVRPTVDSSTVLIEATTANGKIVISPLAGSIVVTIPASETNSYATASAVYDLETEDSSSPAIVKRRIEGTITLSKQVTR
jgi:hypothetical protein